MATGGRPVRRLAWRNDPPPVRKPEMRDQLGLRIGWVRLWLRAATIGFVIWLTGASLVLWPPLQGLVPPFFYAGLIVMPASLLLAGLSWITPVPRELRSACPGCGHEDRLLVLPFLLKHTCRHCRRSGVLRQGRLQFLAGEPREG